ncbi:hypothetical protein [Bacillus sp. FJAT-26390]|uniref:hypothetical protein n=1 Tax=Bacillus sp. FJAT-26390 TaxID=1743142 RepID=UPI000807A8A1|nr:hypothetical protein [Bacillus sp. FJAT-26390]OBZ08014.1 hypothetical protein A7975_27175 [Bacillus sp. FJAT-26390]
MLPEQAKFLLFKAAAAYPNQIELEEETVAVWVERLAKVPFEWGIANLDFHIDTDDFFPKIANITRYDLQPVKNNEVLRLEADQQFALLEHWIRIDAPAPDGYWENARKKIWGERS